MERLPVSDPYMPAGVPGPIPVSVELRCVNPDCPEYDHATDRQWMWEAEGIEDLGTCELVDESLWNCEHCGESGETY